ncbi:MAG TPA: recombinase family protein, partial [Fimbriiglobus sp.]|nr:recombinase family protein [Fimbriiglobus sp.]
MPKSPDAVAFSYIRFSTKEQAAGDSLRRQAALRDAWCERNGVTLDKSLTLADKGVSGFSGKHRENEDRHALALFLKLAERGRIPKGSYLVVENLDRLSREDIRPALTLFLQLLDHGINVVQLEPETVFKHDKTDPFDLMRAILELSRGHSESRMKSERIGAAWAEKKKRAREDGTPITANVPGWLRVAGGKIVPVPDRVRVVKKMFRMAGEGRGLLAIAQALNADGVQPWGRSKAWNPSTLQHILRGKAVLGVYQPRDHRRPGRKADGPPLSNVYPAVISESEWGAAQESLDTRQRLRGRRSPRVYNPFSGLLFNAADGHKFQ